MKTTLEGLRDLLAGTADERTVAEVRARLAGPTGAALINGATEFAECPFAVLWSAVFMPETDAAPDPAQGAEAQDDPFAIRKPESLSHEKLSGLERLRSVLTRPTPPSDVAVKGKSTDPALRFPASPDTPITVSTSIPLFRMEGIVSGSKAEKRSTAVPEVYQASMSELESKVAALVLQVQRSEKPKDWETLISLLTPWVRTLVRRYQIRPSDESDLIQDVFVTLLAELRRFDATRGRFLSWLRAVARNKCVTYYRRSAHRTLPQSRGLQDGADESVFRDSEAIESEEVVLRALKHIRADFQADTWAAFTKTMFEGRSLHDVAEELGISIASVYTRVYRIRTRLRHELEGLLD